MVDITFPNSNPTYCGTSLTLSAAVNGNRSQYSVTAEAPEAYCGARSPREEDLVRAFTNNRARIEQLAHSMFELTEAREIMLRGGHFRFAG
jgi:hypothetical protein